MPCKADVAPLFGTRHTDGGVTAEETVRIHFHLGIEAHRVVGKLIVRVFDLGGIEHIHEQVARAGLIAARLFYDARIRDLVHAVFGRLKRGGVVGTGYEHVVAEHLPCNAAVGGNGHRNGAALGNDVRGFGQGDDGVHVVITARGDLHVDLGFVHARDHRGGKAHGELFAAVHFGRGADPAVELRNGHRADDPCARRKHDLRAPHGDEGVFEAVRVIESEVDPIVGVYVKAGRPCERELPFGRDLREGDLDAVFAEEGILLIGVQLRLHRAVIATHLGGRYGIQPVGRAVAHVKGIDVVFGDHVDACAADPALRVRCGVLDEIGSRNDRFGIGARVEHAGGKGRRVRPSVVYGVFVHARFQRLRDRPCNGGIVARVGDGRHAEFLPGRGGDDAALRKLDGFARFVLADVPLVFVTGIEAVKVEAQRAVGVGERDGKVVKVFNVVRHVVVRKVGHAGDPVDGHIDQRPRVRLQGGKRPAARRNDLVSLVVVVVHPEVQRSVVGNIGDHVAFEHDLRPVFPARGLRREVEGTAAFADKFGVGVPAEGRAAVGRYRPCAEVFGAVRALDLVFLADICRLRDGVLGRFGNKAVKVQHQRLLFLGAVFKLEVELGDRGEIHKGAQQPAVDLHLRIRPLPFFERDHLFGREPALVDRRGEELELHRRVAVRRIVNAEFERLHVGIVRFAEVVFAVVGVDDAVGRVARAGKRVSVHFQPRRSAARTHILRVGIAFDDAERVFPVHRKQLVFRFKIRNGVIAVRACSVPALVARRKSGGA